MREVDVVEVEVHAVGIDANWAQPLVVLRETGLRGRMLPIWIGEAEAAALAAASRGTRPPRPDTHMLITDVVRAFGSRLDGIAITGLRDSVFHAELIVDGGSWIDARASDAIVIALRADVGIEVADAVFDQASVPSDEVHGPDDGASPAGPAPGPGMSGHPSSGSPLSGARPSGSAPSDSTQSDSTQSEPTRSETPLSESEVERFRQMLDDVSPSDFEQE